MMSTSKLGLLGSILLLFTLQLSAQTIQKNVNGQWVNWWFQNGNSIQIAQNGQWVNMLQVEGDVVKTMERGQWTNKYYIKGSTIQRAENGQWVNRYYLEGNAIKKAVNGQWVNHLNVVNGNTIQTSMNGTWTNMYYVPDGITNMALIPCILESDMAAAPSASGPPVAGAAPPSAAPPAAPAAPSNPPVPVTNNPPVPVTNNPAVPANSQKVEAAWSKERKEAYYMACKNDLAAKNSSLSTDNQEAICLCYLKKLTTNYSVTKLDDLIGAEVKQIQNRYYDQCAAQLGINLNQTNTTTTVNTNTGYTEVAIDQSKYRRSKKRGGSIDYADKVFKGYGYSIGFNNTVAKSDYCKAAFKVINTSSDYLLLKNKGNTYTSSGGSSQAKKDKTHIILPGKAKSYTILFEGNYFMNDNFGVTVKELYRVLEKGNVVTAPNFVLPASIQKFTAGNFEVRLKGLVKETKETVATFEVTYLGEAIGLVKAKELGALYTKNRDNVYANDARNVKDQVLEKGKKCTIKAIFHISAKVGDMQFENMEIIWRNTFQESSMQHIPVGTIEMTAQ